ncbi:MAG: DUF899 family protein [Nitrosopumilus sp.]|nr:DUF899 family protein [Nitrosopumilus sp.]
MSRTKKLSEQVKDYKLLGSNNQKINLSKLFGQKNDLILVHNMGTGCPYCTMWADGFNGLFPHLQDRSSFAVSSPDDPATQMEFASSRGWKFQMVSTKGTTLAKDMGFEKDGMLLPGVSVFYKENEKIIRVGRDDFGPGDKYCPTFPLFDLLKDGTNNWQAKFQY